MLDLQDIQGIVFSGYGHLPHARFILLQISDAKAARAWLGSVTPHIVRGTKREHGAPKPDASAHIALTCAGLQAIGLDASTIVQFPREFTEGMSLGERPRVLGDTGASTPQTWEFGGPDTAPVHMLLALYGENPERMVRLFAEPWYPANCSCGMTIVYTQDTWRKTDNEPFGFRDGISQPDIQGGPVTPDDAMPAVAPGEFLLGYNNEYANVSPAPTVSASQDPTSALPKDGSGPNLKAFGRNGSYLVLRKLQQDFAGFWRFCEQQAQDANGNPDTALKEYFAAKLVGRWPSGCPLTMSPDRDDAAIGPDAKRNNDFLFAATDENGYACPIGSHIRRSNPRDVLHPNNASRSITVVNRHRIMRRGRPYATDAADGKDAEVGLMFIAVNADLQRQFEFVQQTWLNDPAFNGLFNDSDPIVSNQDEPGNMTIQRAPARRAVHGVPAFVTVRGGAYFFLPGLRALEFLANLPEPPAT